MIETKLQLFLLLPWSYNLITSSHISEQDKVFCDFVEHTNAAKVALNWNCSHVRFSIPARNLYFIHIYFVVKIKGSSYNSNLW